MDLGICVPYQSDVPRKAGRRHLLPRKPTYPSKLQYPVCFRGAESSKDPSKSNQESVNQTFTGGELGGSSSIAMTDDCSHCEGS